MFSKIMVVLSGILFVIGLIIGTRAELLDVSLRIAIIGACGTVFATISVWYYKKAQAENIRKIMITYYKQISSVQLHYNEKMMELKKKYQMSDDDVQQIHDSSPIDEAAQEGVTTGNDLLKERSDEAMSPPDINKVDIMG